MWRGRPRPTRLRTSACLLPCTCMRSYYWLMYCVICKIITSAVRSVPRFCNEWSSRLSWCTESDESLSNAQLVSLQQNDFKLELGRFTQRTSDIGNIGAKLNIGISVASVCRCVIVTQWHAFNKPHSPLSTSVVHGCKSSTDGWLARWNTVMQSL